jgi:hypothetical protein
MFAYGQTGSGKTYTIDGKEGIIHSTIEALYRDRLPEVVCQFYQIYNEKVLDLLNPNRDCPLKMRFKNDEFYVQNLSKVICNSESEIRTYYA